MATKKSPVPKSAATLRSPRGQSSPRAPTHDEIAARARALWLAEGRPEGRATEHWLEAERQLRRSAFADVDRLPKEADELDAPGVTPPVEEQLDDLEGSSTTRTPRSPTAL